MLCYRQIIAPAIYCQSFDHIDLLLTFFDCNSFLMDPDYNQYQLALCAHHYLWFLTQPPQPRLALHDCALPPVVSVVSLLVSPILTVNCYSFSTFSHGPLKFLGFSKKTGGDVVGTTITHNTTTTLYLYISNCIYPHNTTLDMCTRFSHYCMH